MSEKMKNAASDLADGSAAEKAKQVVEDLAQAAKEAYENAKSTAEKAAQAAKEADDFAKASHSLEKASKSMARIENFLRVLCFKRSET
ncbi:hypothetical protein ACVWQG_03475 [Neisseria meningitidis]